jgi:LysM repeat protein
VRPLVRDDSPSRAPAPARPTSTEQAQKAKPEPRRAAARVYTVRAGDTLASIASRTGVPLTRILTLNPRVRPTSLFIGQKIQLR